MSPAEAVAMLDLPSWEHVGALLLSHGITDGTPRNCQACPVALLLEALTGESWTAGACTCWPTESRNADYRLPKAAQEFINRFDSSWWAS